ncbi:MAG: rhomboid family intramembrane serine protease, partial [Tepidisphaeraceae bacterium]
LTTGRPVKEQQAQIDNTVAAVSWFLPIGLFPIAPMKPGARRSPPLVTWLLAAAMVLASAVFFVYLHGGDDLEPSMLNLQLWTGNAAAFEKKSAHLVEMMERKVIHEARQRSPRGVVTPDIVRDARRRATTMATAIHNTPEGVGFRAQQLLTHVLIHDPARLFTLVWHGVGCVLFLLIFGLRLNTLLGNGQMLIVYALLASIAAGAELLLKLREPLHASAGASGMICGLAGMYAVLFATSPVHVAAWVRLRTWLEYKSVAISGFWLVVAWFVYNDMLPSLAEVRGEEVVIAHGTHAATFVVGAILSLALLAIRMVEVNGGDMVSVVFRKMRRAIPPSR